jgi:SOS-response transcriptional repressor LexA
VKDLLAGYPEVPDRPTPPSTYDQFLSIMHRLEQLPTEVAQVAADQRRVPIVGYADCSLDLPVIERETGEVLWLNLPDLPADARAVIARHDSMESKGVLDGDFLLVVPIAQQPISNGETALVIIQRRGQNAVCKEIYIHRHGKQMDVYAYPLAGREKMASVPYEEGQEWEIKARVIGVFRRTVG